jgi:hypothetical protein
MMMRIAATEAIARIDPKNKEALVALTAALKERSGAIRRSAADRPVKK